MSAHPLLTVDDVAARLGLSVNYVYRLFEANEIAVTRLGRKVRCTEESLAAFIASRTAPPRRSRKGAAA